MAQLEQAAGGSDEPIIAAEPTIEDRFAAQIEEPKDEEDPPEDDGDLPLGDDPEGDDEAELEAEDAEEGEPEPIQAPASWTTEEKEEFAKLPREVQETLARRESERDKGLQTKMQENKQDRLRIEQQALEVIQQTQQDHAAALQLLLPEVPEKPSYTLQAQNPQAYAAMMEEYEAAVTIRDYVSGELEKLGKTSTAQQQAVQARVAQFGQELLQEKFPEFLDPEKRPELHSQLRSTALALGYSDAELQHTDAQDIIAIKQASDWKAKADKYDTLMAKQMQRVREGKAPPTISKPGAPQGRGARENQRYTADRQAMRQGDKAATTRVFGRFL